MYYFLIVFLIAVISVMACIGIWRHYGFSIDRLYAIASIHRTQWYAEIPDIDENSELCFMIKHKDLEKLLTDIEQKYEVEYCDQLGSGYMFKGVDNRQVTVIREGFFRSYDIIHVYTE